MVRIVNKRMKALPTLHCSSVPHPTATSIRPQIFPSFLHVSLSAPPNVPACSSVCCRAPSACGTLTLLCTYCAAHMDYMRVKGANSCCWRRTLELQTTISISTPNLFPSGIRLESPSKGSAGDAPCIVPRPAASAAAGTSCSTVRFVSRPQRHALPRLPHAISKEP